MAQTAFNRARRRGIKAQQPPDHSITKSRGSASRGVTARLVDGHVGKTARSWACAENERLASCVMAARRVADMVVAHSDGTTHNAASVRGERAEAVRAPFHHLLHPYLASQHAFYFSVPETG